MEGNPFNWTWTSSKSPGSDDIYPSNSTTSENSITSSTHCGESVSGMTEASSSVDKNELQEDSSEENNLFKESHRLIDFEEENNSVREDIVQFDMNKVNRSTLTDNDVEGKGQKCKYCKARLSKLRWLERVKSRRRRSIRRMSSHCENTSKGCQTSASLFEKAEMTQKELQSIAMILRFKCGRTSDNETFCKCVMHGKERDCRCGEEDKCFEWVWDTTNRAQATNLLEENCLALFHKDYSCGTAAVRGQMDMGQDQHFWEIKMTTPVYGTDMMVGIGTESIDLNGNANSFCSMLGNDMESWGISYDGRVQHNKRKQEYCSRFGQGAIIGVHLDMWQGTLAFFKNRQSLGTAFTGLRGRRIYPMACSTAARSGMKIISSRSFPTSLQFMCCQTLRRIVPSHLSVLDTLAMPPGLRAFLANNMTWLLHALPPKFRPLDCQDFICSICSPLKNVLEGLTDDDDSDDEKAGDLRVLKLADSDNESEEEEEEDDPMYPQQPQSSSHSDFYGHLTRGGHFRGAFPTQSTSPKVFSHITTHNFGHKKRKLEGVEKSSGSSCSTSSGSCVVVEEEGDARSGGEEEKEKDTERKGKGTEKKEKEDVKNRLQDCVEGNSSSSSSKQDEGSVELKEDTAPTTSRKRKRSDE